MLRENILSYLETMWMELALSYGDNPKNAMAWFGNIVDAYDAPKRFYHDLSHLQAIIPSIHSLCNREGVQDGRMIEWAAWFHDYYQDPLGEVNEEHSADVAEKALRDMGFQDYTVDRVRDMILATKHHKPDDLWASILCDADMLILAAPHDEYKQYARELRLEYYMLDNDSWYKGRGNFLRKYIKDGNIFHTETAKRFERLARENMIWELDSLRRLVKH